KRKVLKRRNTVAVEDYKEKGYLPEALFNFLTLLGVAPEDNKEIISKEELIKIFSLDRVNKKSAVFDIKKLNWLNSEYIRKADENTLAGMLEDKGIKYPKEYIVKVIKLMKERVSTVNDFIDFGGYFFEDPISYDEKGLEKYRDNETVNLMQEYLTLFVGASGQAPLSQKEEEIRLRDFAEKKGVKAASLIHP